MDRASEASTEVNGEAVGITDFLALLLRHPRAVFVFPAIFVLVVVMVSVVMPARYTSVTSFIPEVSNDKSLPAGLAGVVGQLGLSLGSSATTSPRFFADLLKSRAILENVLRTSFVVPRGAEPLGSVPLLQLLDIDGDNPVDSLQNGTKELAAMTRVQVDAETNVITLSVTTRERVLSAAVANSFLKYLNDFNTQTRQSKGREQRKFVEARLASSADSLKASELGLKDFYERNRRWQQSPDLTFREGQFRRKVEVEQELYLTLMREYEKAQIDEVNDTPGITVIDAAVPVEEKSFPKPGLFGVMALALGLVVGVGSAVLQEYLGAMRAADPERFRTLVSLLPRSLRGTRP